MRVAGCTLNTFIAHIAVLILKAHFVPAHFSSAADFPDGSDGRLAGVRLPGTSWGRTGSYPQCHLPRKLSHPDGPDSCY